MPAGCSISERGPSKLTMPGHKFLCSPAQLCTEPPWGPGGGEWISSGGRRSLDIFLQEAVSHYGPWRMLSPLCVSGIACELLCRFLFSVYLQIGDSVLQLSSLADLVPSYGEGRTLFSEEQQSRALVQRYC